MCMKIGCPSISFRDGKAHVDDTLCVGCGVCSQLCKVGALESTSKPVVETPETGREE